jgi:hypothetical protein
MKKWIPLFLFLVFAHDVAIDVLDANCARNKKRGIHFFIMSSLADHVINSHER